MNGQNTFRRCRGSTLIEFALVSVPLILISLTVVAAGIAMWEYHTLSFGVTSTARYVSVHGRNCADSGSCAVTVANIVSYFSGRAPALDPARVAVTLKSQSATVNCNPLNTCSTNTNQFPGDTDNGVNFDVTITASYNVGNPLTIIAPRSVSGPSSFTLFAMSRQRILY